MADQHEQHGAARVRPNDYRSSFGEPGAVLRGVEYYDPATHDCALVSPVGVDCSQNGG